MNAHFNGVFDVLHRYIGDGEDNADFVTRIIAMLTKEPIEDSKKTRTDSTNAHIDLAAGRSKIHCADGVLGESPKTWQGGSWGVGIVIQCLIAWLILRSLSPTSWLLIYVHTCQQLRVIILRKLSATGLRIIAIRNLVKSELTMTRLLNKLQCLWG